MRNYLLALDQGTTSSRALLLDRAGKVVAVSQLEFTQIFPKPGWVEHDPMEIWSSQIGVTAEVISRAGAEMNEIAAIGITNQRETAIVWDRETGHPIYNAIVWQDRRTAALCDELKADGLEPLVRQKTGLVIDAYFSGTKIAWILENVPGARERAERGELAFGTVDTWLHLEAHRRPRARDRCDQRFAHHAVQHPHAANGTTRCCDYLGVPRSMLPEVGRSSEVYGEMRRHSSARRFRSPASPEISKRPCSARCATQPGMVKNTYGTGCFMLHEYRRPKPVPSQEQAAHHGRLADRTGRPSTRWRERLHRRRGGPVAARWPAESSASPRRWRRWPRRCRIPAASISCRRSPAGRAALGPVRARHDRRHHAGHDGRAHRARGPRRHRVPGGGCAAGDGSGLRASGSKSCVWMAAPASNNLLMQFQADLLGIPVVRAESTETTAWERLTSRRLRSGIRQVG